MPFTKKDYDIDIYNIKLGKKTITTKSRTVYRILSLLKRGFSPVILIVGAKGMGKSFCACYMGYIIMQMLGKEFEVKKNCVYTLQQAMDLIDNFESEVIIIDEMIELGYRREFYKKDHTHFTKILATQRIKKHVYFLIIPHASQLDRSFAINVDVEIWVRGRGWYQSGKPKQNFTSFDRYVDNAKWFEQFSAKMSNVPAEIWKEYESYSKEMKKRISKRISIEVKNKNPIGNDASYDPDELIARIEGGKM